MSEKLLTESQLAESLGLSPWTVRRFRLAEGLPVLPIAGRFFYRLESVQAWLASRETAGAADVAEAEETGVIRPIKP